jgi:hypothetical protein
LRAGTLLAPQNPGSETELPDLGFPEAGSGLLPRADRDAGAGSVHVKIERISPAWGELQERSHKAVSQAIKEGKLRRPERCEECGKKAKRINAHHGSYLPENALTVQWLCVGCHSKRHPIELVLLATLELIDAGLLHLDEFCEAEQEYIKELREKTGVSKTVSGFRSSTIGSGDSGKRTSMRLSSDGPSRRKACTLKELLLFAR